MRPKLEHGSSLDVSEILHQLDHLLDTTSVEENPPLQIMEVQLKLVRVSLVQGDGHEALQTAPTGVTSTAAKLTAQTTYMVMQFSKTGSVNNVGTTMGTFLSMQGLIFQTY